MNPVGKWKVKEVISFNENFEMVWKTIDELAASDSEDDEIGQFLFRTRFQPRQGEIHEVDAAAAEKAQISG